MENETIYTVLARNQSSIETVVSLEVYKTNGYASEYNNFLTIPIRNGFSAYRLPFTEIIEKGKTYYYRHCDVERTVTINRTSPIEALRDAFYCLTQKNPTTFKPHFFSMIMAKIIHTLRRMYQGGNIYSVGLVMSQDQKYLLNYTDTENDIITVHDDFFPH